MKKLTIADCQALKHGDVLSLTGEHNADGSCVRWRVSGKVKRWKRSPHLFRVPIKHGLYDNGYLDNSNFHLFHKHGTCPAC